MELIKKAVLKDGYFEDGMSVHMFKSKNGRYGVYYYIHCEDRHSPVADFDTYAEALDEFENICVTYC